VGRRRRASSGRRRSRCAASGRERHRADETRGRRVFNTSARPLPPQSPAAILPAPNGAAIGATPKAQRRDWPALRAAPNHPDAAASTHRMCCEAR
jgi:hypothetical protein